MAEEKALGRGDVPIPRFLSKTLRGLVAVDVFGMMALIFVDVFLRYLFDAPIPGGAEIIQFMLATMIFTALPLVTWAEGQIVVSLFEGYFTGRRGAIQRVCVMSVSAACLVLIAYLMWHQAHSLRISNQVTGYLEWRIYRIAYVMFALALVAAGIQLTILWHCLRGGGSRAGGATG